MRNFWDVTKCHSRQRVRGRRGREEDQDVEGEAEKAQSGRWTHKISKWHIVVALVSDI
jgi:hypothetical protein